jgi:4-amino-4-deoxy-L-arabinose transferase-like glycosyltransferase
MNKQSRMRALWLAHWQPLTAFGGAILVVLVALAFRLNTLLPGHGYSAREVDTQAISRSMTNILHHPVDAPYKVVARALIEILPNHLVVMRITSVLFGLGTVVLFYYLVHHWHGRRIAILATILFGLSSWFLHAARLGTPDVMLFSAFALFACGVRLKDSTRPRYVTIAACILFALALYMPGMIWLVLAGVIWQAKTIWRQFSSTPILITIGAALLLLLLLAPLAYGIYLNPDVVQPLLGLPAHFPTPLHVLQNLVLIPVHIFVRAGSQPELWLARTPLLTIFGVIMFVFGVFSYLRHRQLMRVKLFIGILVIGMILISFNGPVTLSLLVPFIYLIIAGGMAYFLGQWLAVFPRNPIARGVGTGAIAILVLLSCTLSLRHYFVAWPHAEPTQAVFTYTKPS